MEVRRFAHGVTIVEIRCERMTENAASSSRAFAFALSFANCFDGIRDVGIFAGKLTERAQVRNIHRSSAATLNAIAGVLYTGIHGGTAIAFQRYRELTQTIAPSSGTCLRALRRDSA